MLSHIGSEWTFKQSGEYLKFSAWYMKNLFFEQKKDKIVKWTAFYVKYNRDYTACIKNSVKCFVDKIYMNL
jgi:hypothetical protein